MTIKQLPCGKSRDFVFEINMPPLKSNSENKNNLDLFLGH